MPPKFRRPAAGKAAARSRRRRPAGAFEEVEPRGGEKKFSEGGLVAATEVSLEEILKAKRIRIKAIYWQEEVELIGRILGSVVEDGEELFVQLRVEGSPSESVITWGTKRKSPQARLHLCTRECSQELSEEGLFHAKMIEDLSLAGVVLPPWENNLVEEDENAALRAQGEEAKEGEKAERKKADMVGSSSSSQTKEAKKSKRKKKKRKKKEKKERSRVQAQKEQKDLYSKTGLDPDIEIRKIMLKKAKKIAKSKKRKSTSSGSDTSSGESQDSGEDLFQEEVRIRAIADRVPGVLAASALKEMQGRLLSHTGQIWEQDPSKLTPLLTAHFRQHLQGKMSAAMGREVRTLCFASDLLLLARPAAALDCLIQRIKALEMQATGTHFNVSQRLELLPRDEEMLAGRMETKEAAREAREEFRIRSGTQRTNFEVKGGKGDVKGGKGKGTKGKEEAAKEKGGKGDGKKEKGS